MISPLRGFGHVGEQTVEDLLDGRLDPDAEHATRAHLADCRDCAKAVRDQREVRAQLRRAAAPDPDESLVAGLMSLSSTARLGLGSTAGFGATRYEQVAISLSRTPAAVRQPDQLPDAARWVFAAALAGGVSLLAIGGSSVLITHETAAPRTSSGITAQLPPSPSASPSQPSVRVPVTTAVLRRTTSVQPTGVIARRDNR